MSKFNPQPDPPAALLAQVRKGLGSFRLTKERQEYVPITPGELHRDYLSYVLPIIGQDNPNTVRRWLMQHGRTLSGLGNNVTLPPYQKKYEDPVLSKLEDDDDVRGSGIFDEAGFAGTVHKNMGIFADHPNLPGFVAREIPFVPSREIVNMNTGAAVMEVPGGGMSYIDRYHARLGPNQIQLPARPPSNYGNVVQTSLPTVPTSEVSYTPVDVTQISTVASPSTPIFTGNAYPASVNAPKMSYSTRPMFPQAALAILSQKQITANRPGGSNQLPANRQMPGSSPTRKGIHGFGDDSGSTSLFTYLVVGVAAGAAAALLIGKR